MIELLKGYWLRFWREPRAAIRDAMNETTPSLTIVLVSLFGITYFIEQASNRNMGDTTSVGAILILALILGPILGAIGWFLLSLCTYGMARLLGGQATFQETRIATTWATIPYTSKWVLLLPELLIFREELFTSQTPIMDQSMFLLLLFFILGLLNIAMTVIYFVIFSKIVGEVHEFSAWRGFSSIVLIPVALVVLMIVIALVIS
ncbi:YIP1 family protein [Lihuaxuella thermophila]|uniref:Yip1 domain-containing protein n=1 Tax=Lihuaxuella thermophila TaxID=1173111 RepID=A0A1H8AC86_9BACL|nr:YIP1 family protein [Lihuaxuella thermophila]SEM68482.1 Yip1 domain-containing protein [Lihuaxuella thermophila]